MKKRSLGMMVLLTIVTLGIYQIFWLYSTKQELNARGGNVPPLKLLFAPILGLVAIALLQLVGHFVLNSTGSSDPSSLALVLNILSAVIGIVAVIAIIPITIIWYVRYCRSAEKVTGGEMSFNLSFWLFVLFTLFCVAFLWPLIMQNSFNKVADGVQAPAQPPVAPAAPQPPTPTPIV
jgi:hypothetical protein